MPSIAPEGGFPLALVRGFAVAAMLSAFGCLVFRVVVLPKVVARVPVAARAEAGIRALARGSLGAAAVLLLVWAALQTAAFTRPGPGSGLDLDRLATAWPVVLSGTMFGHVWLAQMAAVLAALWLVARRPRAALAVCTVAVMLQAGHSHALSMYGGPSLLLGSDIVHLAAAGAWLGGLWPLLLVVRDAPAQAGALAARWFSPLGKWCVAGLVLSAGFQFCVLIGGLPGLIGTAYGWVALAKLGLLGILLGFAAVNRYRLAPALRRGEVARRGLVRSVAVQTGVGLAVVLAAGILGNLPPALHEQPLWPFIWRPSLVAFDEPDLAREVWTGLGTAAVAAGVLASLAWPRLRRSYGLILIPLAAAMLGWCAVPQLSLLLVDAYPTSYYTSPTGFAATSIVQGAALFQQNCATCHGLDGAGRGSASADLTAAHLWEHSDGEMFWWLTHGIAAPNGMQAMPGFAAVLSVSQRWALIDAVRARNAGTALRETGAWPHPVAVPEFDIVCPGGVHMTPEDLRGRAFDVLASAPGAPPPAADVTTVLLTRGQAVPAWAGCVSTDPAAWDALAILTGRTLDTLQGMQLVVDANGWFRTLGAPSAASAEQMRSIRAKPLVASGGGHHHH